MVPQLKSSSSCKKTATTSVMQGARRTWGWLGVGVATCVVQRELERCSNSNDPGTGLVTVRLRCEVLAQENSH